MSWGEGAERARRDLRNAQDEAEDNRRHADRVKASHATETEPINRFVDKFVNVMSTNENPGMTRSILYNNEPHWSLGVSQEPGTIDVLRDGMWYFKRWQGVSYERETVRGYSRNKLEGHKREIYGFTTEWTPEEVKDAISGDVQIIVDLLAKCLVSNNLPIPTD